MKKFLLFTIIVFNVSFSYSQIPFERTYGAFYYHEYAFEAYQSPDSSYIVLGLYDFDSLTFLKFSSSGNMLLDHKIGLTSTNSYYYMYRYDENNYLITETGDIRKIDSLGNQLWFKSYMANNIDARLNPTHDSCFISLAGVNGGMTSQFAIMKFDSSATIISSDTISPDTVYSYFPQFVKELSDRSYIAGLNMYLDTVPLGYALFRIDSSGSITWNMQIPDDSVMIKDVIATSDSGFILAGFKAISAGNFPLALKKFDSANNLIVDSTYNLSMGIYRYQVEQTRDGGFIVGCDINVGTDILITKFDAQLNLQWSRTFGGNDFDYFGSVRQTLDDGYIISGSKFITGNNHDYYLIKTDSIGIVDSLFTSNASQAILQYQFNELTIFPNPTNGETKILSSSFSIEHIEIYNLYGEVVFSETGSNLTTIDFDFLPAGIYFLKVNGEGKESAGKLIKN